MAEVYGWPEAAIYLYPSGGASAAMTYAESVDLTVDQEFLRLRNVGTGTLIERTKRVLTDRAVRLSVGHLYYDNSSFQQAYSATAFNAKVQYGITALNQSASFFMWSAVFTQFAVRGQDGGLFRASVTIEADDVSGL